LKVVAIIPARYQSSRLPGKILEEIAKKSIIHRVYLKAEEAKVFDEIIVATDDQRIYDHCISNQMEVKMTSTDHISGTDRIAEVALNIDADIVINIQGDEPFLEVECIRSLVELLKNDKVAIGTLYKQITNKDSLFDYNAVKLVRDIQGRILYFSRQAIPAQRETPYREWINKTTYFQHLGIYGFRKNTLLELVKLPPSIMELSENLEQLRWLENGFTIHGKEVKTNSFGIDTPEDLERIRSIYK